MYRVYELKAGYLWSNARGFVDLELNWTLTLTGTLFIVYVHVYMC